MYSHELAILRTGLQMTHEEIAHWIDVPVATIAEWEAGAQPIPSHIRDEFRLLCDGYLTLIESMRFAASENGPQLAPGITALVIYDDEDIFWKAHPTCKNLPPALQRAAAFAVVADAWINEDRIVRIIDTASVPK